MFFLWPWKDEAEGQNSGHNVAAHECEKHCGYSLIDGLWEFSIDARFAVRVDDQGANLAECELAHAKATNDYARDETWIQGEPSPAMGHRYHVAKPVADSKSDRECYQKKVKIVGLS